MFVTPDAQLVFVQFGQAQLDASVFYMAKTSKRDKTFVVSGRHGAGLKQQFVVVEKKKQREERYELTVSGTLGKSQYPASFLTTHTGNGGVICVKGGPLPSRNAMLPDKVLENGSKLLQEEFTGTGNLLCHTLRAGGFSQQEMFTALRDSHVLLGELDNRVRLAPGYDGVPPRLDVSAPELAFLSTDGQHGFGYTNGTLTTTGPFGNTNVLVVTGDITQLTDPRRHDNFGRLDKCAQDYLEELSVAVQTERGRDPEWFGTVREFVPDNTVYINKLEQEHQLAFKKLVLSKPELKQELDAYLELGRCDLCDPKLAESLSPGLLWEVS
jgi:hypothetical protein